jgi:DUF3043 family protein
MGTPTSPAKFPRHVTDDGRARASGRAGTLAPVFGRKDSAAEVATPVPDRDRQQPAGGQSKGRATPKRREVERGRRRAVAAPKTRKEAYKAMRERQREGRTKQMAALKAGDERGLPTRDRGPVRRYARDLVDARRSVAEFFLPAALVILVLSFTSNERLRVLGSTLWLALVVLIIIDSLVLAWRLRRGLAKSFPDQPSKGALPYALMRSMQIRRFRLPAPRIKARRRRSL